MNSEAFKGLSLGVLMKSGAGALIHDNLKNV